MSTIDDKIAALEQRLRAYIKQCVANLVYAAPVTLANSNGQGDGVDGRPADEQSQRTVRRVGHAGFRSRPLKDTTSIVLAIEGGASKLAAIAEDDGVNVALEEGEASTYAPAKPNARTLHTKDGDTKIDAAASRKILLNGGGKGAARKDHKVGHGTLAIVFGPGSGAATLSITYTPGDGSAVQTVSGVGGTLTINEAIQQGSASVEIKED